MNRGKYIVLEGPEGVGKTTQIQELARRLQAAGLPVRTLREPDSQSDLTARALRQLTQDPRYPMNTNTEVLLYNAARSQSLQVIKKSVEQGIICVVDRNYLTTLAIQYYGRGDVPDYETINRIISFAVNGVEPDLTIILDAPVPLLKERAKARGQGERFDNLDEAFLERVRAGYLWEAKQRDLPVVFATDEPETIADNIWKLVADTLAVRTPGATATEPVSIKQIIDNKKNGGALPVEPPLDQLPAAPAPAASDETALGRLASVARQAAPNYLTPPKLNKKATEIYKTGLENLLAKRAELLNKLTAASVDTTEAARLTLPAACYFTNAAELIKNDGKLAAAAEKLPANNADTTSEAVTLINYWPHNELSLVPALLYQHSNAPQTQLAKAVDTWPYEQKAEVLSHWQENPHALAGAGYSWEILADFAAMLAYEQAEHQPLTPRYGYEMPREIDEAGLAEQFEACFDASLELYSQLQTAGCQAEAQLVVLLGHKLRFQVTASPAALLNLSRQTADAPKEIIAAMTESVATVHPLIAATLAPKKQPAAQR